MSNASVVESLKNRLEKLNSLQIDEVERLVSKLEFNNCWEPCDHALTNIDWPHAPTHRIGERGVYLVTAGTLHKTHLFTTSTSLELMQSKLLTLAKRFKWHLEAWACFANHYHFIANTEEATCGLDVFIQQFHSQTANELNAIAHTSGRTGWANYFESKLTYQRSYLARLN